MFRALCFVICFDVPCDKLEKLFFFQIEVVILIGQPAKMAEL